MADKKYYWLKLKEDFFDEDTINWIEEQDNGKHYVLFYLKLCLKSLKTDGVLVRIVGEMLVPYDVKKLGEITNTDTDTVRVAMELFKKIGLVQILENGEIYLTKLENMVGSETKWADYKKKQRVEQKSDNVQRLSNDRPKNVHTEIEKEKEIEIELEIELEVEKNKKSKSPATDISNELNNLPCDRDLPPLENNTPKAFEFYEENFVKPNGKVQAPQAIVNDLIQQIQVMGDDLVLLALQKTLEKDATWRYTKTILDNWKKAGIKTIQQALDEKKPTGKKGAKGNENNGRDSNSKLEQQLEDDGMLIRV